MDYETREREMYLERRKREAEWDIQRLFERKQSESRRAHNDIDFNLGNVHIPEVLAVVVIVVGAARLMGLI